MKNDEKIDINLDIDSGGDLSEEEQAKKNYETALRYINIAEHMKQFEDQDKYYHRAIKYLRLSRPYYDVHDMIKDLRNKKFAARAEGKITLYEEACKIRDKAKTPSDYYSAQTIFERVHRNELTHKIPENKVTPEVYQKVCQCGDSEQQAIRCSELAAEKAAEQKRHSLFVSIAFIAAIAALLLFSRTVSFKNCLASIYSLTGDDASAWRAYYYVYERNNDEDSYENYKEHRYQAALKETSDGDTETAISDFKALAKLYYKDSEQQLLALEKHNIAKTDRGEIVSYAGMDWRVLDKKDSKALLVKDNSLADMAFQEGDSNCTWETSTIRTWLNSTFLNENFFRAEIDAIPQTNVITEPNPVYNTAGGNDTSDQVFLLSSQEVTKYHDQLHDTKTCWWLRTPGAAKGSMSFVYKDRTIMGYGYDCTTVKFNIKPAIWVQIK